MISSADSKTGQTNYYVVLSEVGLDRKIMEFKLEE